MILRLADVEFASQDRLDALGLGRIKKVHRAIDVPVVRHRHRLLAEGCHAINELVNVAGAVKKGVFGMKMEMSEFGHGLPLILVVTCKWENAARGWDHVH